MTPVTCLEEELRTCQQARTQWELVYERIQDNREPFDPTYKDPDYEYSYRTYRRKRQ